MNKFRVAYIIVLIMFVMTLISTVGAAVMLGPLAGMAVFWLPLLLNGFLLYTLRDWKECR